MAWHTEPTKGVSGKFDVVIDGFEKGIADSPELGIADMRTLNITSSQKEAMVNFATSAVSTPPTATGTSCTLNSATDLVTYAGGLSLYNGVTLTFGTTTGGVTAGVVYWVGNVTTTTFSVYTNIKRTNIVDLSANVSNTFTTITLSQPTYQTLDYLRHAASTQTGYVIMQDIAGRIWWINDAGSLTHIGPLASGTGAEILTNASGNGVCVLGDWLYGFREQKIDYLPTDAFTNNSDTAGQWGNNWQTVNSLTSGTGIVIHQAISAQDNGMYFCNIQSVASVLATAGNNVDPTNTATYTFNASALLLPKGDQATYIAELSTNLLIGGIKNFVYPWNRIATSFNYTIILAESTTSRIVTSNSTSYIFAGNRGRIYQTNGSNVQLFKKVPDHLTGYPNPYYTWLSAIYWRNQLFFGISATQNDGTTAISNIGGVWAIDLDTEALRHTTLLTGGGASFNTLANVVAPNITTASPGGDGLYIGWTKSLGGTGYGMDVSSTSPYQSVNQSYFYTDLIPVGTFFQPETISQIEFKLSQPLASGESVLIEYRQSLSPSFTFTTVGTSTNTGAVSDNFTPNFQRSQYLQFRVALASTSSSPSYCRVTEIRFR